MKKLLIEEYGVKAHDFFQVGAYNAFRVHQTLFLIVPVSHFEEEELYEFYQMSQFLLERGEGYLASMVLTKKNGLFCEDENSKYILFKCSQYDTYRNTQPGKELARFHQKARSFPYQVSKTKRIGQWKYLWEKRLDQLEGFWRGKVYAHPLDPFEKMFIESFPYYLGLAENAIQYLVDTELDDDPQPIDAGTICHQRFNSNTWRSDICIKLPTDWVFDHASRDIAEYLRHLYFENQTELRNQGFLFLEDYDRSTPLSPFSWRLIYSRLLFPIHYFECIEDYYLSAETEKPIYEAKLRAMLHNSGRYESFLTGYSSMLSMRTKKSYLPTVHWLGS